MQCAEWPRCWKDGAWECRRGVARAARMMERRVAVLAEGWLAVGFEESLAQHEQGGEGGIGMS
jgi:hypothetical protein